MSHMTSYDPFEVITVDMLPDMMPAAFATSGGVDDGEGVYHETELPDE